MTLGQRPGHSPLSPLHESNSVAISLPYSAQNSGSSSIFQGCPTRGASHRGPQPLRGHTSSSTGARVCPTRQGAGLQGLGIQKLILSERVCYLPWCFLVSGWQLGPLCLPGTGWLSEAVPSCAAARRPQDRGSRVPGGQPRPHLARL